MNGVTALDARLDQAQRRLLVVGAVALAICTAGGLANPDQFFRSYLVAYLFWLGLALGCTSLVMLQHLTGGAWGLVIRRPLESAASSFPLLAVLLLPVLLGLPRLYSWARPDAEQGGAFSPMKHVYLSVPFFLARAAFYFAVWIGLACLLNKWSRQQDEADRPELLGRFEALSAPGLLLYGLTATFSAVDWAMSLDPRWFSTIYGVMFIVFQNLAAISFAIIVVMLLAEHEPLSEVISPSHFHDLGNLMLAFVMLWAYVALSQFLIIWSANLPDEITWYADRSRGGWNGVAIFLIAFHFAVPFLLLLSRGLKRHMKMLASLAGALIVLSFVDLYWVVRPGIDRVPQVHWMDLVAPIGVGGIWLAWFARQMKARPLVPPRDPRISGAVHEH